MLSTSYDQGTTPLLRGVFRRLLPFRHVDTECGMPQKILSISRLGEADRGGGIVRGTVAMRRQVGYLLGVGEHQQGRLRLPVHVDGGLLRLSPRQPGQAIGLGQIAALVQGQWDIRLENVY